MIVLCNDPISSTPTIRYYSRQAQAQRYNSNGSGANQEVIDYRYNYFELSNQQQPEVTAPIV